MTPTCDTFWGSHGCELPAGHDPEQEHPIHECAVSVWDADGEVIGREVCSQAQYVAEETIRTRYLNDDDETWGEWSEVALGLFRNDQEPVR